ncbi:hypothetical protein BDZ89DRAFT_671753 [Hymenopellis radicata]|nr:hypothetical protein BDZ89DRAFT_671753 [Hymenopellis radicata]
MTQTVTPCYAGRWPRRGRGLLAALKLPFTCDLAACRVTIGGCDDSRGGCRWHDHGRHFETLERLKEHFRGSPHHPACQQCGVGVRMMLHCVAIWRRASGVNGRRARCLGAGARSIMLRRRLIWRCSIRIGAGVRSTGVSCGCLTLVHLQLSSVHPAPRWVCRFAGCEETIPRDKANMVKEHLASAHLVCVACQSTFANRVSFFKHDLEFHRPAY